ncbi:MAG: hypothetical protein JJE52_01995 [Acidimicrobiia bacterium]|nr:hypothetical protein [Acidimicrobiia bacterium]
MATVAVVLLGDDLLEWILLALGAALLVGNVLALVRPPESRKEGDLERPPLGRSLLYAGIGGIAAIWALASLLSG